MMYLAVFSFLLILVYGALLLFYYRGWKAHPGLKSGSSPLSEPVRVTVLIPARNEAANIRQCLESYLNQDYPEQLRECIVIDDHSSDDTACITEEYASRGVRVLRLQELVGEAQLNSYKKTALDIGIRAATGNWILTTDADCILAPGWISEHIRYKQETGAVMIAGPVKIFPRDHWLNRFQALDFISLQGITGASLNKGYHGMCNGANLSYAKDAFMEVGGYSGNDQLASGDDMFLLQKIARHYPGKVAYLKSPGAIVSTHAETTTRSFIRQRIRWASKSRSYQESGIKWVLLLVYLVNTCIFGWFIFSFFRPDGWTWFLSLLLLKTILEWPFVATVSRFFGAEKLIPVFPLYQPLHILYTVAAGTFGQFGTYQWKGRRVR